MSFFLSVRNGEGKLVFRDVGIVGLAVTVQFSSLTPSQKRLKSKARPVIVSEKRGCGCGVGVSLAFDRRISRFSACFNGSMGALPS